MVGHTDELRGSSRYQLFLIETGTTTFYAIEVIVYLIGAVEGDFDQGVSGQGVKLEVFEAGFQYHLVLASQVPYRQRATGGKFQRTCRD